MEHANIEALIPAYAVGAVDPAEQDEVERHLPACPGCQALLAEYQALCGNLLYTVPPAAAPADLRGSLAAQSGGCRAQTARGDAQPAERSWPLLRRQGWLAAGALALAVLLLATNLYWWAQNQGTQRELAARATAIVVLAQAPRAVALTGDAPAPAARGSLYFDPGSQVGVLSITGLPATPAHKTYQVWLIHGSQRQNGGLFSVETGGQALLTVHAPQPLRDYDGLGITLEPAGGSPGPTSPRLIGVKF